MSSDSSDDEHERQRFQEAAVTAKQVLKQGQLEPERDTSVSSNGGLLDVSADCQRFLAKSLSNTLDRQIKEVRVEPTSYDADENFGIRLFSSSSVELTSTPENETQERPRKKHKHRTKEKISEDMLAAAAVTPGWVLKHSGIAKHDSAAKHKSSHEASENCTS